MRRVLVVVGALLGGVVVLLGAAFAYAQTSLGKQQIGGLIERSLTQPGRTAEVEGLAGLLPFDVRLGRVRLADDAGLWLEVDAIRASLSPGDLLVGRIIVREVGADRIRLERLPAAAPAPAAPAPAEPFALPRIPDSVAVFAAERIYVNAIELGPAVAGEEARFSLDGAARTTPNGSRLDADLNLVRTDADIARATLRAAIDLAQRNVDLSLEANESGGLLAGLTGRPEAGPFDLSLTARGPFSAVVGKLMAEATNLARLDSDLTLSISDQPSIDLNGGLTVAEGVLPPDVAPLVGERLDLRVRGGQRGPQRFALEELSVTSPALTVSGQGTAGLDDRSLDGSLKIQLPDLSSASALAGVPLGGALGLEGTAGGSLDRAEIKLRLTGDNLAADSFAAQRLTTDLTAALLGPVDGEYAGVRLDGQGGAQGVTLDGEPLPAAPDPTWRVVAEIPARGVATIEQLALQAEALTATLTGTVDQATLTGQGQLRVEAPDLAAIMASLGPLAPPDLELKGAVVLTADAAMRDAGKAMDVTMALGGTDLAGLPGGAQELLGATPRLTTEATVTPNERVELRSLSLAGAGLTATGNGTVGLADDALSGKLRAEIADLAALSSVAGQHLAGKATADATVGGTLGAPALALDATVSDLLAAGQTFQKISLTANAAGPVDRIGGDLRLVATQPQGEVALATAYARDGQQVAMRNLSLTGPATNVNGSAVVDLATMLASGQLKGGISDLGALRPWHGQALTGRVDLDAELTTPEGRQDARLNLTAQRVGGDFGQLEKATVDARVRDALRTLNVDATASLDRFAGSGVTVETASLTARGSLADMRIEAKAQGEQQGPFDVSARSALQVAGERRRVELQALDGVYAGQSIELRAPAVMTLDRGVLDIDQLDLRIGQARIQGEAETGSGRVRGRASVSDFPLSMLAAFGGPSIEGTAQADLALSGPLAAPRADLTMTVPDLRGADGAGLDVPPADLSLSARIADGRLAADLRLANITREPITATLTAPVRLSLDPPAASIPPEGRLDGRLSADAELDRLATLAALDGQRLKGPLVARLQLEGTVAEPRLSGRVELGPASVEDALSGIHYRDVRMRLVAAGQTVTIEELRGTSRGNGTVTGTGRLTFEPQGGLDYRAETTLANAEVLHNDLGTVVLSGAVNILGDAAAAEVRGRLEIQRADLQIPDGGGPDIPTLDVVEVGNGIEPGAGPAPAPATPFRASLDVTVDVPARLFIRGRGLDSEWGGRVSVKGPAADARVLGEIAFRRGFLDFLDRRFRIREGRIAFTGAQPPIPEVSLDAAAEGRDMLAIVKVTGPANDFKLELTSEPALPRDEVLARLLFDRDTSSMTPAQGLRLANAVATLEGRGFDAVGKLRRGLGLDTLDVGGESTEDANVRAGRYLADGVYFEVQQGVKAGSSKARVEVELTPNLNATSEVNEQSQSSVGLDWKYDY